MPPADCELRSRCEHRGEGPCARGRDAHWQGGSRALSPGGSLGATQAAVTGAIWGPEGEPEAEERMRKRDGEGREQEAGKGSHQLSVRRAKHKGKGQGGRRKSSCLAEDSSAGVPGTKVSSLDLDCSWTTS